MKLKRLPITPFFQKEPWSCGPVALKIVLDYFKVKKTEKELIKLCETTPRWGTPPKKLVRVLKNLGFEVKYSEWGNFRRLNYFINKKNLPVIISWFKEDDGHYSVVCRLEKEFIWLADPAIGKIRKMPWKKFLRVWFDFEGDYLKRKKSLFLRWWLVAYL